MGRSRVHQLRPAYSGGNPSSEGFVTLAHRTQLLTRHKISAAFSERHGNEEHIQHLFVIDNPPLWLDGLRDCYRCGHAHPPERRKVAGPWLDAGDVGGNYSR